MRNHSINGNQLALNAPCTQLAKVIEMNWRNWITPFKKNCMMKSRQEEIGRISTPVNPPVARQSHLPVRMNNQQISRLDDVTAGMVVYNIDKQSCQRFDGHSWQSIAHYPGERHAGGIVLEVNQDGMTGLITTISGQNTTVQWKDTFHGVALEELHPVSPKVLLQWNTQIIRGNHTTYAVRMASHYCVTANGQMLRGWRIPAIHELLLMLEDNVLATSFKTGSAWAFQEADKISWLHLLPVDSKEMDSLPIQYYVRLVRPF